MLIDADDPEVVFGEGSTLVVPDMVYQCWGAKLFRNKDANGKLGIICNFLMGDSISTQGQIPSHGQIKSAAVLINSSDARALAKELNAFADRVESEM
jgi:hypothetical protein